MKLVELIDKLKDGEEYCEACEGLGFRFLCRAPDDCEEWDCEECDSTGVKQQSV